MEWATRLRDVGGKFRQSARQPGNANRTSGRRGRKRKKTLDNRLLHRGGAGRAPEVAFDNDGAVAERGVRRGILGAALRAQQVEQPGFEVTGGRGRVAPTQNLLHNFVGGANQTAHVACVDGSRAEGITLRHGSRGTSA